MSFENEAVLMEINGASLKKILDFSASRGGDPVAGVRFVIRNNAATEIFVNGKALDETKTYVFLTNDYLANGGDNFEFLKRIDRTGNNLKIRDLLFRYFESHTEPLNYSADGRVQVYKP
jgi:2',3'-cyclic-nucleotide 2'-phosphodiesterase (5'-nucleotidase family)